MRTRLMAVLVMIGLLLTAVGVAQANPTAQTTTALTQVRIMSGGATGQDLGGTFSQAKSVGIGPGFKVVNVQLSGWYLQYASDDHHIKTAGVRIRDVAYNATTGNVSFTIVGTYADKSGTDPLIWTAFYTILALA